MVICLSLFHFVWMRFCQTEFPACDRSLDLCIWLEMVWFNTQMGSDWLLQLLVFCSWWYQKHFGGNFCGESINLKNRVNRNMQYIHGLCLSGNKRLINCPPHVLHRLCMCTFVCHFWSMYAPVFSFRFPSTSMAINILYHFIYIITNDHEISCNLAIFKVLICAIKHVWTCPIVILLSLIMSIWNICMGEI